MGAVAPFICWLPYGAAMTTTIPADHGRAFRLQPGQTAARHHNGWHQVVDTCSGSAVSTRKALLSVAKGSVVRTKSRAAPNTPLRGSYE